MRQHKAMFQYVEEILYSYDRKKGDKSKNKIAYDRYQHTLRVYHWMLRITNELKDDTLDLESLKIATIFHDAGYGSPDRDKPHGQVSSAICRDYLERRQYPPEKIDFICYLIEEHSNKKLFYESRTPIELVVLMEADMLDDTGAMGIILDSWIASKDENATFESVCRHFEKYTYRHMKQMEFVTAPGRRFWHEKRKLVYEFLRQYRRDLGDMR
ncbi:MAG: HD domain-containing protein [Lachnospiraceae bacterium]|nr:HD domain-containing protein [Lachnospiraceae bacterium]